MEIPERFDSDVPVNRWPIRLRGYTVRNVGKPQFEAQPKIGPSDWTLTFDCETTVDAAQRLRFGAFQLRKGGVIRRAGLFHDEDMAAAEIELLRSVAAARSVEVMTVRQFVDWIIFDRIYELGGTVIGFNLPFDISRLALKHGAARKGMRGGFSFVLSRNTDWPRIRVKHLSARMAFINFAAPPKKRTPEGQRKRGRSVQPRRGYFVDVRTLASALFAEGFDLERLSSVLAVPHPKSASDEHGGPLTTEYISYGLNDVQATWECYEALTQKLAGYRLPTAEARSLYSPASLGKAYLKAMNIWPWTEAQADFPPELIGQIMSAYFGGRAEVHVRRQVRQTLYCDFLSMYPTVCTLMGLWRFVIAKGTAWRDATSETTAWLATATPGDLQDREAWRKLTVLVQLKPADDILPVRARYGQEPASNIALNRLTSEEPLWFTLADVLTSKFLSGKTPTIIQAIAFDPLEAQADLQPVDIAGRPEYRVDPGEDFYRRVIDLRQSVKERRDVATGDEKSALDSEQLALKILANATSYGIFIEMVVEDLRSKEVLTCYGPSGEAFPVSSSIYEKPGAFFHPLLATLITGAARLMLGLAEWQALDRGLDWIFCDTDSLAIARPQAMDEAEFFHRARSVCKWFDLLNPYATPGPILQVEDVNFAHGHKGEWSHIQPLQCFAVSSKRYALFNVGPDDSVTIRKASAHGLGHLLPPYVDPDPKSRASRIERIKVDLWQEDLWGRIIAAVRSGNADELDLAADDRLNAPAATRYGANTPELLGWFGGYNRDRAYAEQVRPFNFLLTFQSHKLEQLAASDPEALEWMRRNRRDPSPAAPYDRDSAKAALVAFDRRLKSAPVPLGWLQSYGRSLSRYHLHAEAKFWGGDWTEIGSLHRRHVVSCGVEHIGKEADDFTEQLFTGEDDDAEIDYGRSPADRARMVAVIAVAKKRIGVRKLCREAGVSDHTLSAVISGFNIAGDKVLSDLVAAAGRLESAASIASIKERRLRAFAEACVRSEGLNTFARRLGVDAANLGKVLRGSRRVNVSLELRLRAISDPT